MGKSWFSRGPSQEDLDKTRKEMGIRRQNRFFLKPGQSKRIIFLDDVPFCFHEHSPLINGQFGHHFSCRQGVDLNDPICPLCVSGVKRSYVGYLTILDATGWENKKGERVMYSRQLFPMTLKSIELFNSKKQRRISLVGAVFDMTRTSKDDVRVGNDWDYDGIVDPFKDEKYWFTSKLQSGKLPPEPFDYEEIMMPLSCDDMKNLSITSENDKGKSSWRSNNDSDSGNTGSQSDQSDQSGGNSDALY